ncbi:aldo/keto reductase [Levilactobacillus tujiorum]|uniref:Aldo/keto reductase n=1 Tax=Levilactobacillus tujiorum TaxID=2912243 RepID=A0ABX1L7X2_9LACO|nr:aldo/keto reductase [Levilactobacillus tujiorum]MCH5465436.1 aldo/keto reductase [Levilactobacillus tujiorum]NLR12428.1 aldo/keto reductase [Lactobacillus sp. HBUAS51387]NLR30441.1 aldo/keto reductase [Levilactobacillus tujiorum]NLR31860.1 aldo/keto reductase [Levilactobacillus tujiorum]
MYLADEHRYEKIPVRRAGNTGFQLPAISFGMWHKYGEHANYGDTRDIILKAFDAGIFSFDLAANYGPGSYEAERLFGEVLERELKPYRDELVISSKAGFHMWPGPYGQMSSRKALMASLDRSLTHMGLDYVDIFYSHRYDAETSPEETAVALDDMVRQGKTLYVGISNYTAPQAEAMIKIFRDLHTPFVVDQVSYNMLNQTANDDGLFDMLQRNNAGAIAYGPLCEGLLTDKYLDGIPEDVDIHWSSEFILKQGRDKMLQKLQGLNKIAHSRGQKLSHMALAWLLHNPVITSVITGASKPEHLYENVKAVQNLEFDEEELQAIDRILKA